MASKAAQKRLSKEYVAMQKEPPPFVWAAPDEKNILNWNFLIRGPPDSPFSGGEYHGILLFPPEYPFKPPGIKMFTPSGRFAQDKKICFSMSDFHPGSWNPAWSVATILTGLLSFMLSDEMTTGSVTSSDSHKRAFAIRSHAWNLTQPRFKEAFPDYCTPMAIDLPNMGEKEKGKSDVPKDAPQVLPSTSVTPNPLLRPGVTASNFGTSTLHSLAKEHRDAAKEAQDRLQSSNNNTPKPEESSRGVVPIAQGWTASWRSFIYEKWRICAFIAVAVLLSRFTTR
ncbi:hypothetical protein D9619_006633 [Psilocybe cf. subviscida]|uniref:Ubiquitin-conjugating enzyme E2 6 n=1 Tax=Psilocybe cf. subviscida TaxID=2480587 RepID=A0A8H5B415_9AGAR|nr:hypothetical protein D9619_006633 [Psilocybe cf. subviscida]